MSSLDRTHHAINLVAVTVDAPRLVEHAIFGAEAGAASGGMGEVKLGQLAQQNGSSDAVKEFGKRMETDHSKANDQLKDIASKNSIKGGGAGLS